MATESKENNSRVHPTDAHLKTIIWPVSVRTFLEWHDLAPEIVDQFLKVQGLDKMSLARAVLGIHQELVTLGPDGICDHYKWPVIKQFLSEHAPTILSPLSMEKR